MQINPTAIQKITSFKNLDCLKNEHYYKDVEPLSKGTIGWFEPEDFEKFKEVYCSLYPSVRDKEDLAKRKLPRQWTMKGETISTKGTSLWDFFEQLPRICNNVDRSRAYMLIDRLEENFPEFKMASFIYALWKTIDEVKEVTCRYKSALNYIDTQPSLEEIKKRYLSNENVEGELHALVREGRFWNDDWLWMEVE
jgi:hypothetical protein